METVFITIHDLSLDANIRYCSDSIQEILGYRPNEVRGKSCWDYFHPDEIPFARAIHGKGLDLDKAAALNYCRIKHKDGSWVGCECVFTVVYDVLVASTAIYQRGPKAERRAVEGAAVRRVFSSSPRDPRYHMLSYLSDKFSRPISIHDREPRAALILNRYTRSSPIMFATSGVEQILGLPACQMTGKSFYYCIAEGCVGDSIRTLESAKGNDSIAYLRFYFRNPNLPDPTYIDHGDSETDESEDGGVLLSRASRESSLSIDSQTAANNSVSIPEVAVEGASNHADSPPREIEGHDAHRSSDSSGPEHELSVDSVFDPPLLATRSSASSLTPQDSSPPTPPGIEVEAVVSCTSDGLVVILRRAQPIIPETVVDGEQQPLYPNGLFASPWATEPILPDNYSASTSVPQLTYPHGTDFVEAGFMAAIRDVAAFAWSLTGINGSLLDHAKGGKPYGESIPPGGLPIWDPNAPAKQNDRYNGFAGGTHRPLLEQLSSDFMELQSDDVTPTSSDDEVLWKRVQEMPKFRKPKRRAHHAFGTDDEDSAGEGGVVVQDRRRRKLNGAIETKA